MNPGKLNNKLAFENFTVYGQRLIKNKRRDDEQNEENYDFIIRKREGIEEYQAFTCDNISYLILTVEEYQKEKGYLLLRCEKAKIHSFYDTCTVSRNVKVKKTNGASGMELSTIYTSIPCELVRLTNSSSSESDQQNKVVQRFEIFTENQYQFKNGDKLTIVHKLDTYKATVQNYFRTHTHQIIEIKVEEEA